MAFTETRLDKILGTGSGTGTRPAAGNAGARWIDTTGPTETFDNGTAWVAVGGGSGGALTSQSSALSADVTIAAANTYYDGPTISLVAGTWLLVAAVNVVYSGAAENFTAKLWDGTTVYAAGQTQTPQAAAMGLISLAAVVSPGATTTYKVSVATQSATTALIKATAALNAAGNHNSYIYAVKIA